MSSNRLSLNASKTQFIWFGTPQQPLKLDFALLSELYTPTRYSLFRRIEISTAPTKAKSRESDYLQALIQNKICRPTHGVKIRDLGVTFDSSLTCTCAVYRPHLRRAIFGPPKWPV